MSHKKHLILGTLLGLLAYFCLSGTNACVKLLEGRLGIAQVMLLQNVFGALVIWLACFFQGTHQNLSHSPHYGLLLLRALGGLVSIFFVFISVEHLSVTNATLLLNTGPFFIPFALYLCYRKKINHSLWLGLIPGFLGVLLILHPGTSLFQWYALLPLLSGACIPVVFLSLQRLHYHQEPLSRILFYLFFFSSVAVLPFALYGWETPTFQECLLLLGISVGGFLSQATISLGLKYGSPQVIAPLCYSSVVFALGFDKLFWNHSPSFSSFIGIFLVIFGGIISIFFERKPTQHQEK